MPRICAREGCGKRLVKKDGRRIITGSSAGQRGKNPDESERTQANVYKPRGIAVLCADIGLNHR